MMPSIALPPLDIAALVWFSLLWWGYGWLTDRRNRTPVSLNQHMLRIRIRWMTNMLYRDNRVMDSMLIGHLIHSVSFFASTTVLVLAGLLGVLASAEASHQKVMELGFTMQTDRYLFELKLVLLLGIFVYSFFCFTWAVRQFNYTIALVGAAPLEPGDEANITAKAAAKMMTLAITSFNRGLRGYYYAFASLGWLVHPYIFIALVTLVTYVLWRRQFRSAAFDAIARYSSQGIGDSPPQARERPGKGI
ncbi:MULTISPECIES: DUF599 domain-containing protein [unclassified Azospirillum]|uniref:DUF599 domain-containing protein n=1 Tax=unclassified Azospirillum TaxID=2630922 RepID=UPI000B760416|nr:MULTISPECIES: DUF599 domain-containing protein [unclassified Azospirillum]SNS60460.1 Uncharacterized membrane protein [Azospirillum sp. RU38E]SNS79896.1 Uncharacterized membrane protein [Azospirillum sp. RU37A]